MNSTAWWTTLDQAGFVAIRFLLSVLWQSSILLVATAVVCWWLRGRRAAVRQSLWIMALLAAPLLPLIAAGAKKLGAPQASVAVLPNYARPAMDLPSDVLPIQPRAFRSIPRNDGEKTISSAPPSASQTREVRPAAPRLLSPGPLSFPWALGLLAYVAGLGVFLTFIAMGRFRIHQWIRNAHPSTDARVLETFRRAAEILAFDRDRLVLESACVPAPISLGMFHPRILLPQGLAESLSDDELLAVALHETAHLRRRDPLVFSLVALFRAAFFFHPLVWLAARRISTLAEHCADDAVLDATAEPLPYARLLARMAEAVPRRPFSTEMAAGLLLGKSAFLRRVEAILSDRRERIRKLTRLALAGSAAAVLLSVCIAAVTPLTQKETQDARQVARLIAQLKSDDWLVRAQSVTVLGDIGGEQVAASLLNALQDKEKGVWTEAAVALAKTKNRRAVEPLLARLQQTTEPLAVDAIVRALAKIGDPRAIDPIVARLKDMRSPIEQYPSHEITAFRDPRINDLLWSKVKGARSGLNFNVVWQLVELRDIRLVEPLLAILRDPKDRNREWAARALGRLAEPRAVEPLMALLKEESLRREDVVRALAQIGDDRALPALRPLADATASELQKAAADAIEDVRLGATRVLREQGPQAAFELTDNALWNPDDNRRKAALRALGLIGTREAAMRILPLLDDPVVAVRDEAADVFMYEFHAKDMPEVFALALKTNNGRAREFAVCELADLGDSRALAPLMDLVAQDKSSHRRQYIERLGALGDSGAVPLLCSILSDPDRRMRRAAAGALARTADERALDPLLLHLANDAEESVRADAAQALGRINDPRAIKALEGALSDAGHLVSWRAAYALARLGWKAPNRDLTIRYMIAANRTQEGGDLVPTATPAESANRLEAPFELNTPILTPLTVGTKEYPRVVILHRVEFNKKDDILQASLMVSHITWPDSTWTIQIALLDEQGRTVATAQKEYHVPGISLGQSLMTMASPHILSFGKVADVSRVKRFSITVTQLAPAPSQPKVQQAAQANRVEGAFQLNTPILTPLTVGTKEQPKVLMLHRVEFRKKGEELRATLMTNYISWPDSTWTIQIVLLDERGNAVATATKDYHVPGIARGHYMTTMVSPTEFSFGKVADLSPVKRFSITVTQVRQKAE